MAKTLDQLGVLVLQLASSAEESERTGAADDQVLTVAEVAQELRCSERLVRDMCARGQLKAIRQGSWKIRRSRLRAYERRLTKGA